MDLIISVWGVLHQLTGLFIVCLHYISALIIKMEIIVTYLVLIRRVIGNSAKGSTELLYPSFLLTRSATFQFMYSDARANSMEMANQDELNYVSTCLMVRVSL